MKNTLLGSGKLGSGIFMVMFIFVLSSCTFAATDPMAVPGNISSLANVLGAASTSPSSTKIMPKIGNISINYSKVGTQDVGSLTWTPDFKFGFFGLGADINIPLTSSKPSGYDDFVLRYAEYDDSIRGLRYGVLDNITLGHGLLMNGYTTRRGSQIKLDNQQMGYKGYYTFDKYAVRGMLTKSNIYYIRTEQKVNPTLTFGEYYVNDSVGRAIVQPDGTTRNFSAVAGLGADATLQLPANLEGYAELGQLINHGNGMTAGLTWGYDAMVANANLTAEYRILDKGLVPGYFGVDYENNPIDLTSAEATGKNKNGYMVKLGFNAMSFASLVAILESYNDSNACFNASLSATLSDQVKVGGYYKQPNFVDFRSLDITQGAEMGADITYKLNELTSMTTHYKKSYNPATGTVDTTQYYEIGINL